MASVRREAQMVPLSDVIAIQNWVGIRHLPDFERREKIKRKIDNGRNCARKTARAQKKAVVKITGEVGQEFSEAARETNQFARRYLQKKGAKFRSRVRKHGSARIFEIVLDVAA